MLANYHINAESYEVTLAELKEGSFNEPMITLIDNGEGLHFVIIKIRKGKVEFYDSAKGKYEKTFDEFAQVWQNIIILVNKENKTLNLDFRLKKLITFIDPKLFIITNVFNLLSTVFSIVTGLYLNNVINNVVGSNSMSNLISINIIFILVFISNNLMHLFLEHYHYKNWLSYFTYLSFKTKNKLVTLNNKQLNANNIHDILELNNHLFNIAEFYSSTINNSFSYLINVIVTIILLAIVNPWNILVLLGATALIIIFNFFNYLIEQKSIKFNQKNENDSTKITLGLIRNMQDHYFYQKTQELKNKWLYYDHHITQQNYVYDYRKMILKTFFNSTQAVFFIILVTVNVIGILFHHTTLGKLFFTTNLFQMYLTAITNIFGLYLSIPRIKYSKELLSRINNYDCHETIGISLTDIQQIKIQDYCFENDTLVTGRNGIGKTTLLKSIIDNEGVDVAINQIDKQLISSQWMGKNIIYLAHNYEASEEDILKLLQHPQRDLFIKVIQEANITNMSNLQNLSSGQKQLLSFLTLTLFEHKVILVDELLCNVSLKLKQLLYEKIKPIIASTNFLVVVDHEVHVKNQFKHLVEVVSCIKNH